MKKRYLFLVFMAGIVLMNACQKEHSFESGSGPSVGTLQDDGSGDCLPKTVAGAYVVGIALVGTSNYIDVQVDVIQPGSYSIYTDTVNGMYFRVSGIFTTTGLVTVRLKGTGTPLAVGIHNFIVHYGTSGCTIAVTTVSSLAAFTLNGAPGGCMGASVAGTYSAGTALTASNNVTINVNVTSIGAYSISTTISNGMTFTSSGTFTTTGPQAIVLTGSGTPASAGSTNIPVTAGSSACSFTVTVGGGATFTISCAAIVVNGTYTAGSALTATNTVTISVNVTAVGAYSISTTPINGMTFVSSGTFSTAGTQTVTLTGTGTPTAAGNTNVSLTPGTCTFQVTVAPAAGAATFTVNCASAVVNGTYKVGTALTAANTVTISVNVAVVGSYNIITTATNGMTFSASGTFAAIGTQTITLTGTGNPTTTGNNTIPVPAGTASCNFSVNVLPAAGGAVFVVDCTSAVVNGAYVQALALTATNTVDIDVNVTTAGNYNITTTATNGMTFTASGTFAVTGTQTITLTGSGTPVAGGTFNIPVTSGTTPCNFQVIVDPSFGTWSFKEGATTYSGVVTDAGMDNTSLPPFLIFFFVGQNLAGNVIEIDLVDVSGTIQNSEIYNAAVFTGAANTSGFYFDAPPLGSGVTQYQADFTVVPNTMIATVTSHNTATKTITGTFAGNVQDGSGNPKTITNGTFTATYP